MAADQPRRGKNVIEDLQRRVMELEKFARSIPQRNAYKRVIDFTEQGTPIPTDGAMAVDYTGTPDDLSTATHIPKYGFGGQWHRYIADLPYCYASWAVGAPAEGQAPLTLNDFQTTDAEVFDLSEDLLGINVQPGLYNWGMGAYVRGVTDSMRVAMGIGGVINAQSTTSQEFTADHLYLYDNSLTAGANGYQSPIVPIQLYASWGIYGDGLEGVDVGGNLYIVRFSTIGYFDIE